jgi:hypothetical protein
MGSKPGPCLHQATLPGTSGTSRAGPRGGTTYSPLPLDGGTGGEQRRVTS